MASLPKNFFGRRYAARPLVEEVDVPRRGNLIWFGDLGLWGRIYADPVTGEVVEMHPPAEPRLINSSLIQFSRTTKALVALFPYMGVDTDLDNREATAKKLAEVIRSIDPAAVDDPDSFWSTFLDDVAIGDFSSRTSLEVVELDNLGYVSTEGGPILLIDRDGVGEWSGTDGDDYHRACTLLDEGDDGSEITIGSHRGLLWDMPTGTADIWRAAADTLVLSRPWLNPEDGGTQEVQARSLAQLPRSESIILGRLRVTSGWLAIFWAPESGSQILKFPPIDGQALDLSVGHAAAVVVLPAGAYVCLQDEVKTVLGPSSLRCWIVPEISGRRRL
jgi:hypothetical protein